MTSLKTREVDKINKHEMILIRTKQQIDYMANQKRKVCLDRSIVVPSVRGCQRYFRIFFPHMEKDHKCYL